MLQPHDRPTHPPLPHAGDPPVPIDPIPQHPTPVQPHPPVSAAAAAEPDRRAVLTGLAGLGGLAAGALLLGGRSAQAGPLTPPPGPVGPTGRTTQEIFDAVGQSQTALTADARRGWTPISAATTPGGPGQATFIIAQPGAYYLTAPASAGTNPVAILIATDDVTLDLNGFSVRAEGAGRAAVNTSVSFGHRRCLIRNGTLQVSNEAVGVTVRSDAAVLQDLSIIAFSGATGVAVAGAYGLVMRRCRLWAAGNVACGAAVVESSSGTRAVTLEDIVVNGEPQWSQGLALGSSSSVARRCSVSAVTGSAIALGDSSVVENCSAVGGGISVGGRSMVVDCTADGATGIGITTGFQSIVERCRSAGNTLGGIRVGDYSVVRNCFVELHNNTGAHGIRAAGSFCQILDNAISRCNIGIDFSGVTGCVALRNTLRLCPNAISVSFGGNWYPFVDFSTLNTATNPFANLFTNG